MEGEVWTFVRRRPERHSCSVRATTSTGLPALLSATPKKDRTAGATGGLLREIGEFGVIVLKDFTTILSMHRESRAEILAALREIYDGEWTRSVGSEGARTLHWKGKVGLVAASTAASACGQRNCAWHLPAAGRAVAAADRSQTCARRHGKAKAKTAAAAGADATGWQSAAAAELGRRLTRTQPNADGCKLDEG